MQTGKIQISAAIEGQPAPGSRLLAKRRSGAGWLISRHKAGEPAAALLPVGEGRRDRDQKGAAGLWG